MTAKNNLSRLINLALFFMYSFVAARGGLCVLKTQSQNASRKPEKGETLFLPPILITRRMQRVWYGSSTDSTIEMAAEI